MVTVRQTVPEYFRINAAAGSSSALPVRIFTSKIATTTEAIAAKIFESFVKNQNISDLFFISRLSVKKYEMMTPVVMTAIKRFITSEIAAFVLTDTKSPLARITPIFNQVLLIKEQKNGRANPAAVEILLEIL